MTSTEAVEAVRSAALALPEPEEQLAALLTLAEMQAGRGQVENGLTTLAQARTIADAHRATIGVESVRILEAEARLLQRLGRNREVLGLLEEALAQRRRRGEEAEAARDLNEIARALLALGQFKQCASRAIEALHAADVTGDLAIVADSQFLLGFVNRELQQYDQALNLFQDSTQAARTAGDHALLLRAINEEANVLHFLDRPDEALEKKQIALKLAETENDLSGRASIENDIGFILSVEGRNDEALPAFLGAFETFQSLGLLREASTTAANAAGILLALNRPQEAMEWADRSLEMARAGDLPMVEEMALQTLALIEEALGDDARALEILQQAYTLGKRTLQSETGRTIDDLEARLKAERRQAELEHEQLVRQLELKREQLHRRLWFAAFVAMAIVMALLTNQYRLKARAHREITQAKTELEAAHVKLAELARTDTLTGLANRREAETRLAFEARRFRRSHQPFAVLMLDIDHFKRINDTHGHEIGDRVLESFAEILEASTRSIDMTARWGGEEFLLILPQTDLQGAGVVANSIRRSLARSPCTVEGQSFPVTVTIGVSLYRGESVTACLKRADDALYLGKGGGRDRMVTEEEIKTTASDS